MTTQSQGNGSSHRPSPSAPFPAFLGVCPECLRELRSQSGQVLRLDGHFLPLSSSGPSAAYTGSLTDAGTSNGASPVPTALTLQHGSEPCDSRVGLGHGYPAQSLAHHRCPVLCPTEHPDSGTPAGNGDKAVPGRGPPNRTHPGEDRKGGFHQHFSQSYQQQINKRGGREMKKSFPQSLRSLGARLEEPKPAAFKWYIYYMTFLDRESSFFHLLLCISGIFVAN